MVVASVLVVARSGDSGVQAGAPALAAASSAGITLVGANARHLPLAPRAGDGGVIRDARLDEYLRAHQAARGGVAVAAPGGTLRRVEAVVPVSAER
jgi:sigma-E factor negative regulatory protein RseA